MKYVVFAVACVGASATILLTSFWRQGQQAIFPQVAFVAPSPAPGAAIITLPPQLVEYAASYNPKILPHKPLYLPKMVWQRLELALPRSKNDKQQLLLDRAQERMLIALHLGQKNLPQNADANVLKSQQYLLQAAQVYVGGESERLRLMQIQHASILESLDSPLELVSEAMALNQRVSELIERP